MKKNLRRRNGVGSAMAGGALLLIAETYEMTLILEKQRNGASHSSSEKNAAEKKLLAGTRRRLKRISLLAAQKSISSIEMVRSFFPQTQGKCTRA